jgi:hypothetical protein
MNLGIKELYYKDASDRFEENDKDISAKKQE